MMKGTEKQIKWAEDIKRVAIENLQNNITRMEQNKEYFVYELKAFNETLVEVETVFNSCEEASQIINARDKFYNILDLANRKARYYRENKIK